LQQLTIGFSENFELDEVKSPYVLPRLQTFFSDKMASVYQPIIYRSDQFFDDDEGGSGDHDYHDAPATYPEGIYYRIVYDPTEATYCIQYYLYWLVQNCTGFLGIAGHKYDSEPIYVFIKPPNPGPYGIVNAGQSKARGFSDCRFHKTEVRMRDYPRRDPIEESCSFTTSAHPFYPFGGDSGAVGQNCVKKYPLAGSIYFEDYKPLFGMNTCFHSFSGAESELKGERMKMTLKRLDDTTLTEWFFEHHKSADEEPFGHDVSNPFEFPHVKYVDPKPFLRA
jgi:hypothetical protein